MEGLLREICDLSIRTSRQFLNSALLEGLTVGVAERLRVALQLKLLAAALSKSHRRRPAVG